MGDNGDESGRVEEREAGGGGGQTPHPPQGDQPPQGVPDTGQPQQGDEQVLQAQDGQQGANNAPGPAVQQPCAQTTTNVQGGEQPTGQAGSATGAKQKAKKLKGVKTFQECHLSSLGTKY